MQTVTKGDATINAQSKTDHELQTDGSTEEDASWNTVLLGLPIRTKCIEK